MTGIARVAGPAGVGDLLGERAELAVALRRAFTGAAALAGYGYVETPMFEDAGVEAAPDAVALRTRGGQDLALRADPLPGVLRAIGQHRLAARGTALKVAYVALCHRYSGALPTSSVELGLAAFGVQDPLLADEQGEICRLALSAVGLEGAPDGEGVLVRDLRVADIGRRESTDAGPLTYCRLAEAAALDLAAPDA